MRRFHRARLARGSWRLSGVTVVVLLAWVAPAGADVPVTVPGCYGAGPAVVCDLTLVMGPVESVAVSFVDVPVCAGTCTWVGVPVPAVQTAPDHPICASWEDLAGNLSSECWYLP